MVLASRAEYVRSVLIENHSNFTQREAYEGLTMLLGDGLLTIDGAEHKQQRRMVMPAFHKQRIENYQDIMLDYTLERLSRWEPGQTIDMAVEMGRLTLEIVTKALFNVDLKNESDDIGNAFAETAEYVNRSRMVSLLSLPIDLPFTPYGRFIRAKRVLDEAVYRMIEKHRQSSTDDGDVLSMLLAARDEQGKGLSDKQIHDETLTFLAAGHATTAVTLTWALYLLAGHPEIHARLMDEIQRVLGTRLPTAADLADMPFLELVIKETMRLYPPAWTIMRHAVGDFELGGYQLPAGTFVVLSQYVIHHLPIYWSEPEKFWPDRFGPEQKEPGEDFAYFPFGAGPRTCIGMPFAMIESRLLLAAILQKYTPQLIPGVRVVPQPMITLLPRNGLPLLLESARKEEAGKVLQN